jgi:hypothetical protein
VTGGVAPGWYPDYEAPQGHQRYWDGAQWTERRASAPATTRAPWRWVLAGVLGLVVIGSMVLLLGDRDSGSSGTGAPTAATTTEASTTSAPAAGHRAFEVASAIDGTTFELTNGAQVRLAGVSGSCSTGVLARLVVGHAVTLTRGGPDKDAEGRLLRYVQRGGVDVGKTLIQLGWANASDDANPRRAVYRRIDARTPDICG